MSEKESTPSSSVPTLDLKDERAAEDRGRGGAGEEISRHNGGDNDDRGRQDLDGLEKQKTEVSMHHPSAFPDGGFTAWLCVLGGFASLFCSFGEFLRLS
jgi:hypothetical protein